MSHVRLVNVTKKFGDVTAVNSLNLEIAKGECFSMLGPSGCGKTTTLRMVAGFEDLSDGEIYVGDRLISSPKRNLYLPPEKRNFGMVFQAFAVWPHLSVYDNVAFPLQIRNFPAAEIDHRTKDALRSTNLLKVADDSPADLSGGGKQRVALARAIVCKPRVLLLDEPLGALDLKLRKEMQLELKALQRQLGMTFIHVTHDQEEALAMSDRVAVMNSGVVHQIGTASEVYERPQTRFVAMFIGDANLLEGTVHSIEPELAWFTTAAGLLPARPVPGLHIGQAVTLLIRPEHIRLAPYDRGAAAKILHEAEVALSGTMDEMVYQGSTRKVLVTLSESTQMMGVFLNSAQMTLPDRGDSVQARWPVGAVHILVR